jgi:hypothetical protein
MVDTRNLPVPVPAPASCNGGRGNAAAHTVAESGRHAEQIMKDWHAELVATVERGDPHGDAHSLGHGNMSRPRDVRVVVSTNVLAT